MTQGSKEQDDLSVELPPDQEARLFASLRQLGDPRPGELDDATMLARVLGAVSETNATDRADDRDGDPAPEISSPEPRANVRPISDEPAPKVRPRPRPAFRRTVAVALAGFAVVATVAYAAQHYVRSVWTSPGSAEGTVALPSPTAPHVAPRPSPASSVKDDTTTADDTTTTATEEPATTTAIDAPPPTATATASAPPPSADELLKRAQKLYTSGDMAGATAAYRALIARYPGSGEARAALITLGQLALAGGRAAEALSDFDRYLASGGPLSTEARVGRIAALRSLGRTADERAAIEQLLAQVGDNSVHAARLNARLAELSGR